MDHSAVTKFWFNEINPKQWFEKDEHFDLVLSKRFKVQVELALKDKLDHWAESLEGCVSLIILLDQFTRNIYRDAPKAFAGDSKALALCLSAIVHGYLQKASSSWSQFLLMPMMHSENLAIQEMSLPLFKKYTNKRTFNFANKHYSIIKEFGRFPHRNSILGRKSSDEEHIFLREPGSSF